MTSGSSGGPWFTGFTGGSGTGRSVYSYGDKGVTAMFGPQLNPETASIYNLAKTATRDLTDG
jgi:hypothetical protein